MGSPLQPPFLLLSDDSQPTCQPTGNEGDWGSLDPALFVNLSTSPSSIPQWAQCSYFLLCREFKQDFENMCKFFLF